MNSSNDSFPIDLFVGTDFGLFMVYQTGASQSSAFFQISLRFFLSSSRPLEILDFTVPGFMSSVSAISS